ncbi:MAG TPA: hypothetical protein VGM51_17790 [Armatimonadota bacterium]|jgi:hypothetical protein
MNRMHSILIASVGVAILATGAFAQAPGGMQMTPAVQAKMKAWQKWNDSHKNIRAVSQTVGAIVEMQKDPKTAFRKAQAKTVLGILKTWRNKPVMSDAQAQKVNKQLAGTFTMAQLKKLASMPQRGGGRGFGGGGQGGPRPGGPGGFGGGRPGGARPGGGRGFDLSKMPAPREYNPLNPGSIPMERQRARATERIDGLIKTLSAAK